MKRTIPGMIRRVLLRLLSWTGVVPVQQAFYRDTWVKCPHCNNWNQVVESTGENLVYELSRMGSIGLIVICQSCDTEIEFRAFVREPVGHVKAVAKALDKDGS